MSKAEELAKKYCKGSSFEDACMEKPAYIAGYHQAEKDLKGSLVAEIEERYNECLKRAKIIDSDYWNGNADAYRNVLAILNDTFEVEKCEEEPYITKKVGSYTTTTKMIKKGE